MANGKPMDVRKLTIIAILAAAASVLYKIEFVVIPAVPIYKFDLSSLTVLLGTFSMGCSAGLLIQLVKDVIGLITSTSGGVGELADFVMSAAMLLTAGLMYSRNKSRRGALCGMALGTLMATVASVFMNMYVMIPFFVTVMGVPEAAILGMGRAVIPAMNSLWEFVIMITAPFNLFKWVVISLVTYFIYKPLSPILHGRKRAGAAK